MSVIDWDAVIEQFEDPTYAKWSTPGELAYDLDYRTKQTPALDIIDEALVRAFNTPDSRLIISMPPQEGKSQRASRRFPLWCLLRNPDLRIAMCSYESRIAERWGRTVRDDIRQNPHLGLFLRDDISSQKEWQLESHEGGMYSAGVGGALTGRPVDLLLIDDPVKGREQADSETIREKTWDWWTDTALSRLAPGAPVILILTRWHDDDLAGRLIRDDSIEWEVINIPAEAEDEDDILGRVPGEFMESARGRSIEQWEARKNASGPKTWASLYQGHPSPGEGGVFPPEEEWARYDQPMWVEREDGSRIIPGLRENGYELIQSWDMTFKDNKSSDFVVGQVWLRVGIKMYLLDMVRARLNFNASVQAVLKLSAKWPQSLAKLIEDKANGTAILNLLGKRVMGMIPIEPQGSKLERASAVSPFVYAKNAVLPTAELLPNVGDIFEETNSFPNAKNDDTVDSLSQALSYALLHDIVDTQGQIAEEWLDDERISPY